MTLPCSRAQAESLPDPDELALDGPPPVIVSDEPDPSKPDDWLIHAYFDSPPSDADIAALRPLGLGDPQVEQL